jgi:hypothetical protein
MSASEPSGTHPPRHRGRRLGAALIVAGVAAIVLAGGWWLAGARREAADPAAAADELRERLRQRIEKIEAEVGAWETAARRREDRLADLERVHRGLREELLALRERIELIDRTLGTLLEREQGSAARAALAEIDHLLAAAELRDRMLLDRRGALALLRAARALAEQRPEPAFAEVERAIAADLVWLERHQPDPEREALRRRLEELAALAPALSARDPDHGPGAKGRGLGRLIHVERVGESSVPLLPEAVARLLLAVELRLLELAATIADVEGFERARTRLAELIGRQFKGAEQERALAILGELADARLIPGAGFPERARGRVRALLAGETKEDPPAPEPPSPR